MKKHWALSLCFALLGAWGGSSPPHPARARCPIHYLVWMGSAVQAVCPWFSGSPRVNGSLPKSWKTYTWVPVSRCLSGPPLLCKDCTAESYRTIVPRWLQRVPLLVPALACSLSLSLSPLSLCDCLPFHPPFSTWSVSSVSMRPRQFFAGHQLKTVVLRGWIFGFMALGSWVWGLQGF